MFVSMPLFFSISSNMSNLDYTFEEKVLGTIYIATNIKSEKIQTKIQP